MPATAANGTTRPPQANSRPNREGIAEIQRARMLAAMIEAASELGAANVTVAHVVARSGVSRRTFYDAFADREECLLAAFDCAAERMTERIAAVYQQKGSWRVRIRAALEGLLQLLDDEPSMGNFVIVQALGAGRPALERRQRALLHAIAAVDEGRAECRPGSEPAPLTAEGVVGAVLSVIHSRLLDPSRPSLVELTSELMGMIVLPYLGPAAARKELSRPVPVGASRTVARGLGALRGLDMRLTYRTMRVLLAIGEHPAASNRRIAEAADIHDQGQVSKLLRRLQDLGLARNSGERVQGERNAWTLTERGAAVREAISAQISAQ
jgi:AcrR family transcriptional regulator/DNA-binding MarR family transcriptional regulator